MTHIAYILHAASSEPGLAHLSVTLSVAALVMGLAVVVSRLQR